jgi:ectoine hydroxylase-related dioxygenase (phytanoyl-CoA dioxygenase family)
VGDVYDGSGRIVPADQEVTMSSSPTSTSTSLPVIGGEVGVFGPDEIDGLDSFFREHGFVILRGVFTDELLDAMETECVAAQQQVTAGEIDERYGTGVLIEGDAGAKATTFTNYVTHVNELSPAVLDAATHQTVCELMELWLGNGCWLLDDTRFGVVYQDARPGRESSYTRIGWHSDWQSGPDLDVWPSVAFTFHIDGTGPDNGFLRVVPGSHKWATPAPFRNANDAVVPEGSRPAAGYTDEAPPFEMPLGFAKVPGEVGVYTERGDVIFHDAYLWHSAARGTDDDTTRRHVRGGWYSGEKPSIDTIDRFVKNAAR